MKNSKMIFRIFAISLFIIPAILFSQTVPLQIGVLTQVSQTKSSTLRFEINLPEPCEINIQVTGWQNTLNWGTDFDRIYFYNSSNEIIGRNEQSAANDPFLFHMIGDPADLNTRVGMEGTYYIDFHSGTNWGWPAGKEDQNYTVLVTAEYVTDTNEKNDDMITAKEIYIGETINAYQWEKVATNSVSGDEDWYKINLPSPGKLTLELDNWVGTFNWSTDFDRFYVYDEAGNAIGSQSSNQDDPYYTWMMSPEDEIITIHLATGGIYYLRFHSGSGYSTQGYTLTSSFIEVVDLFEPNDDMNNAKSIEFGIWYNAYQWRSLDATTHVSGDEDYYQLTIPGEGKLTITLNDWNATYNWSADYDRMYIYNSNGTAVGSTANDPYYDWMMGGGNKTEINLTNPGVYYVRLHSGAQYSTVPYKILFEFSPSATDIEEENDSQIPDVFSLSQNYPNPVNPTTTITYTIPAGEQHAVSLQVFDILGREIATLVNGYKSPGTYKVYFNANNLPSGIYYYKLIAGNFVETKKMMLLK